MPEEAESSNTPANRDRSWTPVVPVPQETVAVAMFQWKRLPLTKKVVLRYCALFVAIVIGTAILGYLVASMGPATYGARTEITYPLAEGSASGGFLREDRTLQTQLVAIKSQTVLDKVSKQLNVPVDSLASKITATVVDDSNVIRIQAVESSPSKATKLAGAVASAYFKTRSADPTTAVEQNLKDKIAELDASRKSVSGQIADLEAQRLRTNPPGPTTSAELELQSELSDLLSQRSAAVTQLNQVTIEQLSAPKIDWSVQPYAMDGKITPKPIQGAIAGFLAGIMIAILVIGLLIRRLLKREPDPVA